MINVLDRYVLGLKIQRMLMLADILSYHRHGGTAVIAEIIQTRWNVDYKDYLMDSDICKSRAWGLSESLEYLHRERCITIVTEAVALLLQQVPRTARG